MDLNYTLHGDRVNDTIVRYETSTEFQYIYESLINSRTRET